MSSQDLKLRLIQFKFFVMKKFLVSIFLIAAVGVGASAQNEQGGNQRPRMDRSEWVKRRTEMMVQKYGLNEKQAAALRDILRLLKIAPVIYLAI